MFCRTESFTESEITDPEYLNVKETIIDVLMEYGNLLQCHSLLDFGIDCSTNDCYRVLYLYKYRRYNDMLDL